MRTRRGRLQVLWAGIPPTTAIHQEFLRRDLSPSVVSSESDLRSALPTSCAVVFCAARSNVQAISELIASTGRDAMRAGLRIVLIGETDLESEKLMMSLITNHRLRYRGKPADPPFRLVTQFHFLGEAPYSIAEECARWDPGPPPTPKLEIKVMQPTEPVITLDEDDMMLLRRSFNDCDTIEIEPLGGGFSSAKVFKVHAQFDGSMRGGRPLPMYAKIDRIGKIQREFDNYSDYIESAVPFNLRPNPIRARCILDPYGSSASGYGKGIIVGNFVEQSEPLWHAVKRGHGHEPIYSLFDNAFKSWRLSAEEQSAVSLINGLEAQPGFHIDSGALQARYVSQAYKFGAKKTPAELCSSLRALSPKPHRVGIVHADLHADNVRSRGRDAVIIDFYSVRPRCPLLLDVATLELSLAFCQYGTDDENEQWKATIDTLYSPEHFLRVPPPARQQHQREWLWNTLRQLRTIAIANQLSTCEYQTVLSHTLLRRCNYPVSPRFPAFRFAYGYVVAERLVKDLIARDKSSTTVV